MSRPFAAICFSLLIFFCFTVSNVYGQLPTTDYCTAPYLSCTPLVMSSPGTVYGCPGSLWTFTPSYTLSDGYTIIGYRFIPAGGVSPSTGTTAPGSISILTDSVCKTYNLSLTTQGTNIIQNGNFRAEGGDSGYTHGDYECMGTFYGDGEGAAGCSVGHVKIGGAYGMCDPCVTAGTDWYTHTPDGTRSLNIHARNSADATHEYVYFWGQPINTCGGVYKFTYWLRMMGTYTSEAKLPQIKVLVGDIGLTGTTLELGYAGPYTNLVDESPYGGFGTYDGTCSTEWQERSFIFTIPAVSTYPAFICMVDANNSGASYAIDDISMVSIDTTTTTPYVTLCPTPPPPITITSDSPACEGSAFHFFIHGPIGDSVSYTITRPGASPVNGNGAITSGTIDVSVPLSTSLGTVCLTINTVWVPSSTGLCPHTSTVSRCVPVITHPTGGLILGPDYKCTYDSAFSVSVSGVTGATSYHWSGSSAVVTGTGTSATVSLVGSYAGTATITCVAINDCGTDTIMRVFTIYSRPAASPLGETGLCAGYSFTFDPTVYSDSAELWTSSNSAIATIGASSGLVTGISPGVDTITLTLIGASPAYCTYVQQQSFTVLPTPTITSFTGSPSICPGASDTIAVVTAYTGTATVTYNWSPAASPCSSCSYSVVSPTVSPTLYSVQGMAGGCYTPIETFTVTIKPEPTLPVVTGEAIICPGFTTTLTATATAGTVTPTFHWGPASGLSCTTCDPTYATPPSSTVYSVAATALGCTGPARNYTVTVNPSPVITAVSSSTVCIGSPVVMSATVTGATHVIWEDSTGTEISGALIFTLTPTTTGNNLYKIIATNDYGCADTATTIITVNSYPSAPYINGPTNICPGDSVSIVATSTYTGTGTLSYVWASSTGLSCTTCDPTIASPSATTIYTVYATSLGCTGPSSIDTVIVYVAPTIISVSGDTTVCSGTLLTDTLSGVVSDAIGYTWTGPDTFYSTSLTTGITFTPTVSGVYTLTASSEHCSVRDTVSIHILYVPSTPYPANSGVFGTFADTLCKGAAFDLFLRDTYGGDSSALTYVWSPAYGLSCTTCNPVTVSPSVTTVYSVYATGLGCPGASSTFTVTIKPVLPVPSISGGSIFCAGASTTLTATYTGSVTPQYSWTPGITSCSTCTSVVVTPTVSTFYNVTVSDSPAYCGSGAGYLVTVIPLITPTITGTDTSCQGGSSLLTGLPGGGTWSSSDPTIASVNTSGLVYGINAGTVTIAYTYMDSGFACSTLDTSVTFTVIPETTPFSIDGPSTICLGSMSGFYNPVPGGVWSSSNDTVASVDTFGNVYGLNNGTAVISYTTYNGSCYTTVTDTISVMPLPAVPAITGFDTVCILGTTVLIDSVTGGVWSSYNTAIANVDPVSGTVTGGSAGTASIAYDVTNGCGTTEVTDSVLVIPSSPAIIGNLSLCSGFSSTLSNTYPGGVWSSSNPAVASVDSSGTVAGISSGTTTITYSSVGACGPFTSTATLGVNVTPYITTNFIVACQGLSGTDVANHHAYVLSDTGCIDVCDSTVMRYYANGYAGSTLSWTITGGTILANYGDSIDVLWPTAGIAGSIRLGDTLSHCMSEVTLCIEVIQKPRAYFTQTLTHVCLGSPVSFIDLSTADVASPIVSWYWSFGDGTTSEVESPTHTYSVGGTKDSVMLVVRNACNCSDTFWSTIKIAPTAGPVISCGTIACEGQTAIYSVPNDSCAPSYFWSAVGGTIEGGEGSTTVRVRWDHVNRLGYGYLRVIDPCSSCSDTAAIKIPVILPEANISGPDTICLNTEYEYTLPLWPGTRYMWGVLGDAAAIVNYRDDYKLVVSFTIPGTYTIHGWYQNELELCGGNVDKTIVVVPNATITGPTSICDEPITYLYNVGGLTASWTQTFLTDGGIYSADYTDGFNVAYNNPGIWQIAATGDFCAAPIYVNVQLQEPPIDSVKGADTVCLGHVYTYTAYSDTPGAVFSWQAVGGTVTPASGSATVTVVWNGVPAGASGMSIQATRVGTSDPFCTSTPYSLSIVPETISLNVTGDVVPCANSYRNYGTTYNRGEEYDWAIYPETAGSVVSGDHTDSVQVLWNNYAGPGSLSAYLVLTVHKCDSVVIDSLPVFIPPSSYVNLTIAPNPVCPGASTSITATTGGASYDWNFGDGTTQTTILSTTSHAFPENTTTDTVGYLVRVTVHPNPDLTCPIAGTATNTVRVLPAPRTVGPGGFVCLHEWTSGVLTDGFGALAFQWYNDGVPISGATNVSYYATDTGHLYYTVTGDNGCVETSPIIWSRVCELPAPPDTVAADSGGTVCLTPFSPITEAINCNQISLSASLLGSETANWVVGITPSGTADSTVASITVIEVYTAAGTYHFDLHENFTCGSRDSFISVAIGAMPDFTEQIYCSDSGMDSVYLRDNTVYLPGWTITDISWSGPIGGTGDSIRGNLAAPGTYLETETITYRSPSAVFSVCSTSHYITLPTRPSGNPTFSVSASTICSGVPVKFTPVNTGGLISYSWNFGDSSSSLLDSTHKVFTYDSAGYHDFTVSLSTTDTTGCAADSVQVIRVYGNMLDGRIGGSETVCSGDTVTLAFVPTPDTTTILSYLWSTGETTSSIRVDTSGTYWVTVTGLHQCQATLPKPTFTTINYTKIPPAIISGLQNYCVGSTVSLTDNVGTGVGYQWYRDTALVGTTPSITDSMLAVGDYQYMLVLTLTDSITGALICSDTARDSVHIHPLPPPPVITGPVIVDCNTYHLQLMATAPEPGTYNWSNGIMGNVDDIYAGGDYEVLFTDQYGCTDTATQYVPNSADVYLPYFPTGCYSFCDKQFPITMYGPPDMLFHPWYWIKDSAIVSSGVGLMMPYVLSGPGTYNWGLSNGLCGVVSDNMDVGEINCDVCQGVTVKGDLYCIPDLNSYEIDVLIIVPAPASYTLGTDMGPVLPFSGTVPSGTSLLTLTYTSITMPPPSVVNLDVTLTFPGNTLCYQSVKVPVPACTWDEERTAGGDSSAKPTTTAMTAATALLIYPNPASGNMNIAYDYGNAAFAERSLCVYDNMGRKVQSDIPEDIHGDWNVNTADWTPGIYIVRMEGDGKTLQTQRVVVTH